MSNNAIDESSKISGKVKTYTPFAVGYPNDEITENLINVIIVFCYLQPINVRLYDKIVFYEILTPEEFLNLINLI